MGLRLKPVDVDNLRTLIHKIAAEPAPALVDAYYNHPKIKFAAELFDEFGDNPPDRFVADDLVAVSLLDVRFGPEAVRALLIDSHNGANALLADAALPNDRDIWDPAVDLSRTSPSWRLWDLLVAIPNVGATRASKLLARKRPRLLPILDSVVTSNLGLQGTDQWAALRHALSDDRTRAVVQSTVPTGSFKRPSVLRLLDVMTWMRFSESDSARTVRAELGMTVTARKT